MTTRATFFAMAALRRALPTAYFTAQAQRRLPRQLIGLPDEILDRVAYYNRLDRAGYALPQGRPKDLPLRRKSMPRIDLMRVIRGFGPDLRADVLLGDVMTVPDRPTLLKSRPIYPPGTPAANANSVVLPLGRLRHFQFQHDPFPWEAKQPRAVWRGRLGFLDHQPERIAAVRRFHEDARADIGQVNAREGFPPPKPWLSVREQLGYRYILALEGNDVASNLKWVMNSNSVALSPPLRFETWFMEGRLVPDRHFIALAPDLSDLHDKIAWAEANPEAVARIRQNAHDWVARFRDPRRDELIAALVVQKYIEATGGQSHSRISRQLFFGAPGQARLGESVPA